KSFRGDVAVLDRDRDEPVDVGEEMDAAEVAARGREEAETEVARRRDRSGEIAERDQVGPTRTAAAPARADGHATGRQRGADRAPEVEASAPRVALAAREPAAEPRAELAHERPRLFDVARGELREGERQQATDADSPTAPVVFLFARSPLLAGPRGPRPVARLLARRRSLALPFAASRTRRHPIAAGEAPPPSALLAGDPTDEREHRVEEHVERRAVPLVLHERRRERLAQHLALDAGRGDGGDGVHRLRDRDLDAARPERLHELEDALAHRGDASRDATRSQ